VPFVPAPFAAAQKFFAVESALPDLRSWWLLRFGFMDGIPGAAVRSAGAAGRCFLIVRIHAARVMDCERRSPASTSSHMHPHPCVRQGILQEAVECASALKFLASKRIENTLRIPDGFVLDRLQRRF
jgi:hypothetical protein